MFFFPNAQRIFIKTNSSWDQKVSDVFIESAKRFGNSVSNTFEYIFFFNMFRAFLPFLHQKHQGYKRVQNVDPLKTVTKFIKLNTGTAALFGPRREGIVELVRDWCALLTQGGIGVNIDVPEKQGLTSMADINPSDTVSPIQTFSYLTPWKINMDHNHGGLEDHFPF